MSEWKQYITEGKLETKFKKVVKALQKTKLPLTAIISSMGGIDIIVGWDAPEPIIDGVFEALQKAKLKTDVKPFIGISGDTSDMSRGQYKEIERINGGHKDY